MSNDAVLARAIESSRRTRINRRQLLKAGAWATPAVVLATAAPSHAASPAPAISVDRITGTITTQSNSNTTYSVKIVVTNNTSSPKSAEVTLTAAGVAVLPSPAVQLATIAANSFAELTFTIGTNDNGAKKSVTATPSGGDKTVSYFGMTVAFQGGKSF